MVDPLSYFLFQTVFQIWCNKHNGMYYPVCGMALIKYTLLVKGVCVCGVYMCVCVCARKLLTCLYPLRFRHTHHESKDQSRVSGEGEGMNE